MEWSEVLDVIDTFKSSIPNNILKSYIIKPLMHFLISDYAPKITLKNFDLQEQLRKILNGNMDLAINLLTKMKNYTFFCLFNLP